MTHSDRETDRISPLCVVPDRAPFAVGTDDFVEGDQKFLPIYVVKRFPHVKWKNVCGVVC